MNKTQKIVISIVVTLIMFIIAFSWSTSIEKETDLRVYGRDDNYTNIEFYELRYNWYVWILYLIVVGGFNFCLCSDKRQNKKKDKRD